MKTDELKQYLDNLVHKDNIPSVDCIVYKNHEEIFRYMTGTVNEEKTQPVSPNQLYLMFSMTKVQTMTALMQLVEQGKISLEDEVAKYLPAYEKLTVKTDNGDAVPAKNRLLVKHLVSMQSGLDYDLERAGIVEVLKEKRELATTQEIVNAFPKTPLLFEPGTHFEYSLSHDVVAAIIEVVSGMKFSEYLKKNIWEPLNMKDTRFAKPLNEDERIAEQYICDEMTGMVIMMDKSCMYQISEAYESGGAGLISSTADYAKLADALATGGIGMNGIRILEEETVRLFQNNLLGTVSNKELVEKMGRIGYGYGIGMQIFLHPEHTKSNAPAGIFGWDGAAGSCIQMDISQRMSFVFTMHVRNYGPAYSDIHPALRDMIFGK